MLASSVYIVCRPGIHYPLTGVVYGICHTRYIRILGKTTFFFYGVALSDHKKSVTYVTQESSKGVGCQPTTLPAALRLVRAAANWLFSFLLHNPAFERPFLFVLWSGTHMLLLFLLVL